MTDDTDPLMPRIPNMYEGYKSAEEIRRHIARVDRELVALLAHRCRLITRASAFQQDGGDLRGATRVEKTIAMVCELIGENNASPERVERAYQAMIDVFIAQELKVH